jgi:hypothetical protein
MAINIGTRKFMQRRRGPRATARGARARSRRKGRRVNVTPLDETRPLTVVAADINRPEVDGNRWCQWS